MSSTEIRIIAKYCLSCPAKIAKLSINEIKDQLGYDINMISFTLSLPGDVSVLF